MKSLLVDHDEKKLRIGSNSISVATLRRGMGSQVPKIEPVKNNSTYTRRTYVSSRFRQEVDAFTVPTANP